MDDALDGFLQENVSSARKVVPRLGFTDLLAKRCSLQLSEHVHFGTLNDDPISRGLHPTEAEGWITPP
jgi:hypothetical protein